MKRLAIGVLALWMLGCGGEPAAPAVAGLDLDAARRELTVLFEAISRADCAAIRARMPSLESDERCRDFLHDSEEHGLELIEVIEVVPDGRDPRSAMARTGVRQGGHERQILIRATAEGDRWTFVM